VPDDRRRRRGPAGRDDEDPDLVVVDRATGGGVGAVVINDREPDDCSCNFRIAIGPGGRDRGFGSQATRLVVDPVLTTTDAHRIGLDVFEFNPRSVMMSILRPQRAALTPTASAATPLPGDGGTR
jgi:RimJ/RimL family protein N-acetyltransferase